MGYVALKIWKQMNKNESNKNNNNNKNRFRPTNLLVKNKRDTILNSNNKRAMVDLGRSTERSNVKQELSTLF